MNCECGDPMDGRDCQLCETQEKLRIATEALQNLVNECSNGTNLGKSWSEYQIDDSVIAEARAALAAIADGVTEQSEGRKLK